MDAREAAYLSLVRCENSGKYSNLEVDAAIKKHGLEGAERALFTSLVYGVIEKKITLDYYISALSSRPLDKLEGGVKVILRLGIYQILYLDRIPDSAACNESVNLAKKHTHKGTSGFVNAILRSAVRQKEALPMPKKGTDSYLSVKYSCPTWLCEMWRCQYGEEKLIAALEGINRSAVLTLRVNTLKITRDELISRLSARGIDCHKTEISPFGVKITSPTPISELSEIEDGLAFVQDESSQMCVMALAPRQGETIIDCCACPGGKSFSSAICMENIGKVMSFDLHESKLSLISKGAKRLGIDIISPSVQNGEERNTELVGIADRVLCDVPCSGLGVIAKKPDLRHKGRDEITRLPQIQLSILKNSSAYVRQGGTLVYSTCTVNKDENENIVRAFIREHPEFSLDLEKTVFPGESGADGFYFARLQRK